MSIKSRLQKNREAKSFGFSNNVKTGCDLLKIFQEHTELSSMTVYSYNKIVGEKDGKSSKLAIGFSSYEDYYDEISKLLEISGNNSENPHVTINIQNITINIYMPPLTVNQPVVFFSRQKNKKNENVLPNKLISNEILSYFEYCLVKKANIFIAGDASVDKSQIMSAIADLVAPDKKIILCDSRKNINIDKPCVGRFSKQILKSEIFFDYDNIFCADIENEEFTDIFKLIISGFCGFVVSFSVKNDVDMLSAIRNIILLSNTNLFEENADFMTTSSMDVIVNTENDLNGNVRIVKVSETSKNKLGEVSVKDIFVWNEYSKAHVSAGNNSKYFYSEYMQELYKHHYSDNKMFEQFVPSSGLQSQKEIFVKNTENDFSQKTNLVNQNIENRKTKLDKLREKIHQFKAERLKQNEQQENNVENINTVNDNPKKEVQFVKTEIQQDFYQEEQPIEKDIIPVFTNYPNNQIQEIKEVPKEDIFKNPNAATLPDITTNTEFIDVKTFFKNEENLPLQIEQEITEEIQNNFENIIIEEDVQEFQENEKTQEVKNVEIIEETKEFEQTEQINASELTKKDDENSEVLQEFSEVTNDFEINKKEEYDGRIDVEQIDLVDSEDSESNQGVLASENDDFLEEEFVQAPKIRNILEEDDEEEIISQANAEIDVKNFSEQKEINNNFESFTEKYQEEFKEAIEEEQKPKDPELFKEIDYIDVDNYDVADIPDEDI